MELSDLIPDKAEFTLKGKTYLLRAPTLEDSSYFARKYGARGLRTAFEKSEWEVISAVAVYLFEDRSDFVAENETTIDGDGEKITRRILAPELLRRRITTTEEKMALVTAITSAFTNADPAIKQVVDDELKKKGLAGLSDGMKSLTSSQAPMAGQPSTSYPEP